MSDFSKCQNFQEVIDLNKAALDEAADFIYNTIQNATDVTPTGLRMINTIEQVETLVWEQKHFFIDKVIKPFMEHIDYRMHMYSHIANGDLNPDKKITIQGLLKLKVNKQP
jgi:hypothetical protein